MPTAALRSGNSLTEGWSWASTGRLEGSANGGVVLSDDGGKTWSDVIDIDNGGVRLDAETDVIELKDGTLYAAQRPAMRLLRLQRPRQGRGVSPSRWGSRGIVLTSCVLSDDIILVAHRVPSTSLHYSLDECRTWSDNVLVDSVGGAYPSMVNLKGRFGVDRLLRGRQRIQHPRQTLPRNSVRH